MRTGNFCLVLRAQPVRSSHDLIQKTEKTLNNTRTTKQYLTNNGFRNIKKHPNFLYLYRICSIFGTMAFN